MDVGRELVNEIFGTAICRKSIGELFLGSSGGEYIGRFEANFLIWGI